MSGVVAGFTCERLDGSVAVEGETTSGVASRGTGELYEVTDGAECRLTVRDTRWANGERDLVACRRHDSPQRFDTLIERLRLPIVAHGGELYAELRHARLKSNHRGNLFVPDERMLDEAAGISVAAELQRFGARRVGPRAELLDDTGRAGGRLGVLFPHDAELVPLASYVCTRVAPVARGYKA